MAEEQLTVNAMRGKARTLQQQILGLIKLFEAESGCVVHDIQMSHLNFTDERGRQTGNVHLDIHLL